MKRFLSLSAALLLCLLILAPCASALNFPAHTFDLFVNDFASVISETDRKTIQQQGEELYRETKAQIAVATVSSLEGSDIETYANEMFRTWALGDKEENNGVLLLLSVGDRKVRIEVGYGLEGALNDSKCGRILREYGNPYFSEDNFSEGLASVYSVLIDEVCDEYDIARIAGTEDDDAFGLFDNSDDADFSFDETDLEIVILIFGIVVVILTNIIRRVKRVRRGGSFFDVFDDDDTYHGGGYHGGGFFGGGGGGFSGGGGGFSGGGGSSGGGGASSSF